ncbi:hypothetical protein C0J52_20844 [Blattella germanica]|nr:hypothetical protein C0J52_20844 [Blattella germanica]
MLTLRTYVWPTDELLARCIHNDFSQHLEIFSLKLLHFKIISPMKAVSVYSNCNTVLFSFSFRKYSSLTQLSGCTERRP